jgi:hypothetical protein
MKKQPSKGAYERARALRREMTDAERKLWQRLRSHQTEGYRVLRFWNNEALDNPDGDRRKSPPPPLPLRRWSARRSVSALPSLRAGCGALRRVLRSSPTRWC